MESNKKILLSMVLLFSFMCTAAAQDRQLVTKEQAVEIARQYAIGERGKPESWFGGDADAIISNEGNWFVVFTGKPDEDGYIILGDHFSVTVSVQGEVLDYGGGE